MAKCWSRPDFLGARKKMRAIMDTQSQQDEKTARYIVAFCCYRVLMVLPEDVQCAKHVGVCSGVCTRSICHSGCSRIILTSMASPSLSPSPYPCPLIFCCCGPDCCCCKRLGKRQHGLTLAQPKLHDPAKSCDSRCRRALARCRLVPIVQVPASETILS